MYSLRRKLYINYTQTLHWESKSQRDKETKSQSDKESKREREEESERQRVKETKRQREGETKSQREEERKKLRDKESKRGRVKERKRQREGESKSADSTFKQYYSPALNNHWTTVEQTLFKPAQTIKQTFPVPACSVIAATKPFPLGRGWGRLSPKNTVRGAPAPLRHSFLRLRHLPLDER